MDKNYSKVLVLFSGGQDSTTCLYWAIEKFGRENIETLNIEYGQRHKIEIEAAKKIAEQIAKVPYHYFKTSILKNIGDSALFNMDDISHTHRSSVSLPASFVPGRNVFFLTIAAAFAYKYDIFNIVTGVCQTDYSGYPDCRKNTINAVQLALSLGMDKEFEIHTPLMYMTKSETVELAMEFPGCMEALSYSQTCYEGKYPPCNECPACKLRTKGFEEAGILDPIFER